MYEVNFSACPLLPRFSGARFISLYEIAKLKTPDGLGLLIWWPLRPRF